MDWQATWVRSGGYGTSDDSPKGDFGEFGLVYFYSREYPTVQITVPRLKSADRNWWRCLLATLVVNGKG